MLAYGTDFTARFIWPLPWGRLSSPLLYGSLRDRTGNYDGMLLVCGHIVSQAEARRCLRWERYRYSQDDSSFLIWLSFKGSLFVIARDPNPSASVHAGKTNARPGRSMQSDS